MILLAFLALLVLSSSAGTVSAFGCHYELDKPYYHPGDAGKLLLSCQSEGDEFVYGADLSITGVGVFKWNMTGVPEDRRVWFEPNSTYVYSWKKGETLNIEIDFTIPADARPGEYSYTWTIHWPHKTPFTKTDVLTVYAAGEEPSPAQPLNPLLLAFVALPVLLVAYPVVRWKNKKAARLVGIGIIAVTALDILFGGFLFIFLAFNLIAAFYPLLIALILAVVVVSIIRRRRGGRRGAKVQRSRACWHCGRDLSALPKDIAVCPYCGGKLDQRICAGCGRDLSALPMDIRNCPYCTKTVRIQEVAVSPAKPVKAELPERVQRIRRYTKTSTLLGVLIAAASFIIGPLLGGFLTGPEPNTAYMFPILHEYQNTLWYGVFAGILTAVASGVIRFLYEGRTGKE